MVFGDKTFKVIEFKLCLNKIMEVALIQYGQCPCKRRLGHRHTPGRLGEDTEHGHLQAREKEFRRNQLCRHLNLRFIAPGTVTKEISVVETTQSVVLGYGSPNRLMHWLQSLCLLADTNKLQKGFFGIKRKNLL